VDDRHADQRARGDLDAGDRQRRDEPADQRVHRWVEAQGLAELALGPGEPVGVEGQRGQVGVPGLVAGARLAVGRARLLEDRPGQAVRGRLVAGEGEQEELGISRSTGSSAPCSSRALAIPPTRVVSSLAARSSATISRMPRSSPRRARRAHQYVGVDRRPRH